MILKELLKGQNIKIPYLFFKIIKGKFALFRSKLNIEITNIECKLTIMKFIESLIIIHFINNISDPY